MVHHRPVLSQVYYHFSRMHVYRGTECCFIRSAAYKDTVSTAITALSAINIQKSTVMNQQHTESKADDKSVAVFSTTER